jgi:hypothetical protein
MSCSCELLRVPCTGRYMHCSEEASAFLWFMFVYREVYHLGEQGQGDIPCVDGCQKKQTSKQTNRQPNQQRSHMKKSQNLWRLLVWVTPMKPMVVAHRIVQSVVHTTSRGARGFFPTANKTIENVRHAKCLCCSVCVWHIACWFLSWKSSGSGPWTYRRVSGACAHVWCMHTQPSCQQASQPAY